MIGEARPNAPAGGRTGDRPPAVASAGTRRPVVFGGGATADKALARKRRRGALRASKTVWLFDLDNTLHDASHAAFGQTGVAMNAYITEHLGIADPEATRLRQHYWRRYGATLLGLVRHHGVDARHFLEETHRHPQLESRLRTSAHDRAALRRLPGRRFVLTNAPRRYAMRVLRALRLDRCFDGILSVEDMAMFGDLRPKPDARMLRALVAKLKVRATDCVLVEDMLDNQKSARGLGMRTAWMQRYLGGRWRGPAHAGRPPNLGVSLSSVRRQACPSPRYVHAKIRGLKDLLRL